MQWLRAVFVSRRRFVHLSITALVAARHPWMPPQLRVHVVLAPSRADLLDGVMFGVVEAVHTASLVGSSIEAVRHESPDDLGPTNGSGLSVIIAGHDAESVTAVAVRINGTVPVLNVGAADDALRGSRCDATVFHVAPSESMRSRATHALRGTAGRVAAWHPTLVRYGAEQLNDRYRARHPGARGMSADAWCGWMGVKIAADSALRSRATTNAELIAWMSSPRARFDGHKGVALGFDGRRQLRQPLYLVSSDDRVTSEVAPDDAEVSCA